MAPRTMQEHIGEKLPDAEVRGHIEMQSEGLHQNVAAIAHTLLQHQLHHEDNDVDEQQVASDGRNVL